ncbi:MULTISPECIES: NAD(P)/FAD-dependent oxidoreductase [unclassified Brevundimonas]|uniref:NAD(P)/FAD-dependent oxidoreductase n=1 Tax=unclassified Brevundimonas TaxID=2622653 RepID=UPI0025C1BF24|nr:MULTISPECIES: NAD(P)/FAD-dependent oxidoreductase [unclassified Brevundimonas]
MAADAEPIFEPDVIVIGAGPAGLTAALYLARYRRKVLVLHDGKSRALRIPLTHNAPGFPEGVRGPDLIARMTRHAVRYGAAIQEAEVAAIKAVAGGFRLHLADGSRRSSRAVVLATGVDLAQVDLPEAVHEAAIRAGVLRYCPVCDGYEHIDERIGVIGCDTNGAAEALFLRGYSRNVTLMPLDFPELSSAEARALADAGIRLETGALRALEPGPDDITVRLDTGVLLTFDVVYPALGCRPRSSLAKQLGLSLTEAGCVTSDSAFDSPVKGVFAAGDLVEGLDQISVAMGHGAVAATRAHNWLRAQDRSTLPSKSPT